MITPPSRIHQAYVNELSYVINNYMKKNNHPCKIYPAPFVVFLNKDKMTYVEPDISVICDSNKLTKKGGCVGAPDRIIEVVSPSSRRMDEWII